MHADGLRIDDVAPLQAAVDGATGAVAYVQVLGEQELNPESRVRLGSGSDALGMPTIELDSLRATPMPLRRPVTPPPPRQP